MKVSTRLIIGFLVIILLMIIAISFSVYSYKKVHDEYELLKEDIIPGAFIMNVMEYHGNQIHLFTVWYALRKEKKDELKTSMMLLKKTGTEHLGRETHAGLEEQRAAELLQEKIQEVVSIATELVDMKDQGVAAPEILKKGGEKLYPVLESLIAKVKEHKAVHMEELTETKEAIYELHVYNIWVVLAIGLIMLILVCAIAILTIRSIVKPVRALTKASEIIGTGDLDYRVGIKTKDELGLLGMAFDKMAGDLKRTTTSIDKLNKEIAERKKAEGVIEEKNKELQKLDQLKSDFISTVSHEIRTPLSITKEGISLVLDGIPGEINEEQTKVLAAAKGNVDRLTRIINELLDISKIEAGKVELKKKEFDIIDLVREVVSSFELETRKKGLELNFDIPKSEIFVYADRDKIIQVFANLLSNAVKNTEKGYMKVEVKEKKEEVECSVSDTGKGISKENIPKVFDRFRQFGRKAGPGDRGTGLGLSIAKGIVDMHEGKMWVESKFGKGTKFTFVLPKK